MYERLPFDKSEIITKLGTKSFTRIKNEDQQRVIWEFLLEQSALITSGGGGVFQDRSLYFVRVR